MHERINITLPEETIRLLDRAAPKGNRSRLIDEAIRHFIQSQSRKNLREQLKEGAIARRQHDLELAEEWFPLEEEAWLANKKT